MPGRPSTREAGAATDPASAPAGGTRASVIAACALKADAADDPHLKRAPLRRGGTRDRHRYASLNAPRSWIHERGYAGGVMILLSPATRAFRAWLVGRGTGALPATAPAAPTRRCDWATALRPAT